MDAKRVMPCFFIQRKAIWDLPKHEWAKGPVYTRSADETALAFGFGGGGAIGKWFAPVVVVVCDAGSGAGAGAGAVGIGAGGGAVLLSSSVVEDCILDILVEDMDTRYFSLRSLNFTKVVDV